MIQYINLQDICLEEIIKMEDKETIEINYESGARRGYRVVDNSTYLPDFTKLVSAVATTLTNLPFRVRTCELKFSPTADATLGEKRKEALERIISLHNCHRQKIDNAREMLK